MSGPKIDLDQVNAAIAVVNDATTQMNAVTMKVLAQSDATNAAITAPAGQVTAFAFQELGGGGKALSEELNRLHNDLVSLTTVASAGSEQATQAAKQGGLSDAVATGI